MAGKRRYLVDKKIQGLSKVEVFNDEKGQWEPPARGAKFRARKRMGTGKRQIERWFDLRDEAIRWLREVVVEDEVVESVPSPPKVTLRNIWERFVEKRERVLRPSTFTRYSNMIRLYFASLMDLVVVQITAQTVDNWLDELKSPTNWTSQSRKRLKFKHELDLLRTLLKFFDEYYEDPQFRMPVKRRHYKDAVVRDRGKPKSKNLTPDELQLMLKELRVAKNGEILSAVAEVQYWHALRISEVLALSCGDVQLDFANPMNSFLTVRNSVNFPRKKGKEAVIQSGYKNSKTGLNEDGAKVSRLLPQSFAALKRIWPSSGTGLLFHDSGEIIQYKAVQNAYDAAFRRAGLPYTGTHIMRHGGTRAVYNKTKDLALAQQHLGNSSLSATQVYAQRSANAWDEHVKTEWQSFESEGQTRGKSEK